jgi:hypothetical protein
VRTPFQAFGHEALSQTEEAVAEIAREGDVPIAAIAFRPMLRSVIVLEVVEVVTVFLLYLLASLFSTLFIDGFEEAFLCDVVLGVTLPRRAQIARLLGTHDDPSPPSRYSQGGMRRHARWRMNWVRVPAEACAAPAVLSPGFDHVVAA